MPIEQIAMVLAAVVVFVLALWLLKARSSHAASCMLLREIQTRRDLLEQEVLKLRYDLGEAVTTKAAAERSLQDLRARFEEGANEVRTARSELLTASTTLSDREATLRALTAEHQAFRQMTDQLKASEHSLRMTNLALEKQLSAANSELQAQGKLFADKEREQSEREARLKQDFEALSSKLLSENSSAFRKQSREELDSILKPLKEALDSTKGELAKSKGEAEKHNELLVKQVERIIAEADTLTRVFKGGNPKAFGDLGEELLDGVLRASGLQEGTHYQCQKSSVDDESTRKRPDVIVNLPEGKHLIIDSKASLNNYNECVNAEDKVTKETYLAAHVRDIQKHVKDLRDKHYTRLSGVRSPDFVLMYIPFEQAYAAAMEARPNLWAEALDHGVAIVTNTTLIATLRTVTHVWRLLDQQQNAEEIAAQGGILYDKFCGFVSDLEGVGKALDTCQERYSNAFKKLSNGKGNLMTQADRLRKLGVKGTKEIPQSLVNQAEQDDDYREATQ